MNINAIIPLVFAFVFAPFFRSIINRTKALMAGRQGPPWFQPYRDFAKLLRKGVVYSTTSTYLFRLGPLVSLSCVLTAFLFLPQLGFNAFFHFRGDVLFFVYILAMARFFMVLAALDVGSSFEAMGASRELQFGALVEPVTLLSLATLAKEADRFSLSAIYHPGFTSVWLHHPAVMLITTTVLILVLLTENSRIPIDDPTTHLELTMIHEVIVLDHSGPDLAVIEATSALKLWMYTQLIVGLFLNPLQLGPLDSLCMGMLLTALMAMLIGVIESTLARTHFRQIPQLILGSGVLAILAILVELL